MGSHGQILTHPCRGSHGIRKRHFRPAETHPLGRHPGHSHAGGGALQRDTAGERRDFFLEGVPGGPCEAHSPVSHLESWGCCLWLTLGRCGPWERRNVLQAMLRDARPSPHLYEWVTVTRSCPTLCDPVDCSPPGSSVHGIFRARILGRVSIPFSRGLLVWESMKPASRTWRAD